MPYWLAIKSINWKAVGYVALFLCFAWSIYKVGSELKGYLDKVEADRAELTREKAKNEKLVEENSGKDAANTALKGALDKAKEGAALQAAQKAQELENEKERAERYKKEAADIRLAYADDKCAAAPIPAAVVRMHVKQWEEARARNKVH